jgi:hypothetical protein
MVSMLRLNGALQHTSIDVYSYVDCRIKMGRYQGFSRLAGLRGAATAECIILHRTLPSISASVALARA